MNEQIATRSLLETWIKGKIASKRKLYISFDDSVAWKWDENKNPTTRSPIASKTQEKKCKPANNNPQLLPTITKKFRRSKMWWAFLRNSNMFKDSVKYLEFDLCSNFVMRRWDKDRFRFLLPSEMHLLTLRRFSYLVIHFSYFLLLYFLVFCC